MNRAEFSHKFSNSWSLFAYILAAILTGFFCVLFMWVFEAALDLRLDYGKIGFFCFLTSPLLFILARSLIDYVAPFAGGTGIPQTIFAAQNIRPDNEDIFKPFFSLKTLFIKILCLLLLIIAGGSTGREGPTVQIATCVFLMVLLAFRKWGRLRLDLKSAIVAGAASGLAAAFNTPLAGVTFAIEELTPDVFSGIKDFVLIAIIVAALAAKTLTHEYTYFGHTSIAPTLPLFAILALGLMTGLLGALFSTLLLKGQEKALLFQNTKKKKCLWISFCAIAILLLSLAFGNSVMGPGNDVAKMFLNNESNYASPLFGYAKIASTLLTFWSGLAGGIFAPCLSIGAALGANVSSLFVLPLATCSLLGMAGFLSATIQAPITTFVIIFEMTGDHALLLPVMLTALIATLVARLLGADHFYKSLAANYKSLLG